MEKNEKGWQCPICKTVWSPENKSCPKCEVKEGNKESVGQLLLE